MADSAIDKELMKYVSQLSEIQKKSLLEKVKSFLKINKIQPERITIEQYNREIDEAIARVEAGDFYTQDEVERMSKEW
jgi:hypothetical protein